MHIVTADTAADTAIVHIGDWIYTQWVGIVFNRQRGTARNTDAGVIPGAGLTINIKPRSHCALAVGNGFFHQWLYTSLAIEHALALGNNHFQTALFSGQGLCQGVFHFADTVSANGAQPLDTGAATGAFNRLGFVPI